MSTHAHRVSPRSSGDLDDGSSAAPRCLNSLERHSRRAVWGLFAVAGVLLALEGSSTALGQCHYTYATIPNPPGWKCAVQAINNRGWATGHLFNAGDNYRAFIWTPEGGTTLLPLPPSYTSQRAYDINDHGHVVGTLENTTTGSAAFFWDGTQTTIITRPAWATRIDAYALSNHDRVVGTMRNDVVGPAHGFLWDNNQLVDITPALDFAEAQSIDEQGFIAGTIFVGSERHAITIDSETVRILYEPEALCCSEARGMSNNRWIAGDGWTTTDVLDPNFRKPGVIWGNDSTDVVFAPEGTRDLIFRGMNDGGRAIGSYERPHSQIVAWQSDEITHLNPLVHPKAPPGLDSAWGINATGEIAARFRDGSVVLTPSWLSGDLSGDCHVTLEDLIIVLLNFGSQYGTYPRGDVDVDGDVDLTDLTLLLSNWGT